MIHLERELVAVFNAKRSVFRGYSLIEVLVVVAVVGVLAAIAYPSYHSQVIKTRRTEAQSLLLDIAARQEAFYTDNKTFTVDMTDLGFACDPVFNEQCETNPSTNCDPCEADRPNVHYRADAVAGDTGDIRTSFVATAVRVNQQTADTTCYDFTVDSNGNRGLTNFPDSDDSSAAAPTNCW